MTDFNVTIIGADGVPVLCACGMQATGWRMNTLGKPVYYCADHDPSGSACPLCGGTGRLAEMRAGDPG
ncbi:MAG TPA: hypothetical protein VF506_08965 [Streptosporangiaceae bacterium]